VAGIQEARILGAYIPETRSEYMCWSKLQTVQICRSRLDLFVQTNPINKFVLRSYKMKDITNYASMLMPRFCSKYPNS